MSCSTRRLPNRKLTHVSIQICIIRKPEKKIQKLKSTKWEPDLQKGPGLSCWCCFYLQSTKLKDRHTSAHVCIKEKVDDRIVSTIKVLFFSDQLSCLHKWVEASSNWTKDSNVSPTWLDDIWWMVWNTEYISYFRAHLSVHKEWRQPPQTEPRAVTQMFHLARFEMSSALKAF